MPNGTPAAAHPASSSKRLLINMYFEEDAQERASVEIDSREGFATCTHGRLFPSEMLLIADIIQSLRQRKDSYPPARSAVRS